MEQIHRVASEQDELAMGEIEDAHHAGDHAEAEHDQHEDRAVGEDVKEKSDSTAHRMRSAKQARFVCAQSVPVRYQMLQ